MVYAFDTMENEKKGVKVLLRTHGPTLASALRAELEIVGYEEGAFVSCARMHPLDEHIEVTAPSVHMVRTALLNVKQKVVCAKKNALICFA